MICWRSTHLASSSRHSPPNTGCRLSGVGATDERRCRPRTRRRTTPARSSPCTARTAIGSLREPCLRLCQIDDLGSGGVLLHRLNTVLGRGLRLVGLTHGNDFTIGGLQPKPVLAGLAIEQLELRYHLASSLASGGSTYAYNSRDGKTRVMLARGRGSAVDHPRVGKSRAPGRKSTRMAICALSTTQQRRRRVSDS